MKYFYFACAVSVSLGCILCSYFFERGLKISAPVFLAVSLFLFFTASAIIILSIHAYPSKKTKALFITICILLMLFCSFSSSYVYNVKNESAPEQNLCSEKSIKFLYDFKEKSICYLNCLFEDNLSKQAAGFAAAVILGDSTKIDSNSVSDLKKSGLYHFLAVSGFHISMFTGFLSFLLLRIVKILRLRISISVFIILFVLLYVFIVGPKAGVLRASTVCCMSIAAKDYNLDYRASNLFFTAYILLLLINPGFITQVSFQLSFASAFGIIFIYPVFNNLSDILNIDPDLKKNLFYKSILVSLAVNICILPIIAFYFEGIYLYSIISTAIASPLFFAAFIFLFSSSLLSFFWYFGAAAIIRISNPFILLILKTANFFSNLPYSFLKTDLFKNIYYVIIYYSAAAIIFFAAIIFIKSKLKNS